MQITEKKVVSIHYTVKNNNGDVIDSSEGKDPLLYLHGYKNIIPGLENSLQDKAAGDKVEAVIEPAMGYGESREELIQEVPRSAFEGVDNLEVGMQFQAQTEQGPVAVVITEVADEVVTVDGNHPLAGETLHFNVEVMDVRDASEEEIAHGHVHGPGGHHH